MATTQSKSKTEPPSYDKPQCEGGNPAAEGFPPAEGFTSTVSIHVNLPQKRKLKWHDPTYFCENTYLLIPFCLIIIAMV